MNKMITVNIILPFKGDIICLSCEEDLETARFMDRIKKRIMPCHEAGKNRICHVDQRKLLRSDLTLMENGVRDGSNLVLV